MGMSCTLRIRNIETYSSVMALIPREELKLDLQTAGQTIVHLCQSGTDVTVETLDSIYEPIIDRIYENAEAQASARIDEFQGQLKDTEELNLRQQTIIARRAELADAHICTLNGETLDYERGQYIRQTPNIRVKRHLPEQDVYSLDDETLHSGYDTIDKNRYCKRTEIEIDDERTAEMARYYLQYDYRGLVQYCRDNAIPAKTLLGTMLELKPSDISAPIWQYCVQAEVQAEETQPRRSTRSRSKRSRFSPFPQ